MTSDDTAPTPEATAPAPADLLEMLDGIEEVLQQQPWSVEPAPAPPALLCFEPERRRYPDPPPARAGYRPTYRSTRDYLDSFDWDR